MWASQKTLVPSTVLVSSRDVEKRYEQLTWDEQLSHLSQSCAWDCLSVSLWQNIHCFGLQLLWLRL